MTQVGIHSLTHLSTSRIGGFGRIAVLAWQREIYGIVGDHHVVGRNDGEEEVPPVE